METKTTNNIIAIAINVVEWWEEGKGNYTFVLDQSEELRNALLKANNDTYECHNEDCYFNAYFNLINGKGSFSYIISDKNGYRCGNNIMIDEMGRYTRFFYHITKEDDAHIGNLITKDMTIRELWNFYWDNAFTTLGDEHTQEFNELIVGIGSLLPFESEEEQESWIDMLAGYKGEQEFEDLTEEIIKRTEIDTIDVENEESDDFYYKGRKYTIVSLEGRNGGSYNIEAIMMNFINGDRSLDFIDMAMVDYTYGCLDNEIAQMIFEEVK